MEQELTETQVSIVEELQRSEGYKTSSVISAALNRPITTVISSLQALERIGRVDRVRKGRHDFWYLTTGGAKPAAPVLPTPKFDPAPQDVSKMPERAALAYRLFELETERAEILEKLSKLS